MYNARTSNIPVIVLAHTGTEVLISSASTPHQYLRKQRFEELRYRRRGSIKYVSVCRIGLTQLWTGFRGTAEMSNFVAPGHEVGACMFGTSSLEAKWYN